MSQDIADTIQIEGVSRWAWGATWSMRWSSRAGAQPARFPRPRNRLNQAMTAHRIACQVRTVITESKEDTMATPTGAPGATNLPDYAPVPRSAIGPALNEQGYYVRRVDRNLYRSTDGSCQSAFLI